MLEPESGDRGCTFAVSSWDSNGKLRFSFGALSFSGILASWIDVVGFDVENSLLIGERKAAKDSLGGATRRSLELAEFSNLFEELGSFLNKSVTSGRTSSSSFLLSKSSLRTWRLAWD